MFGYDVISWSVPYLMIPYFLETEDVGFCLSQEFKGLFLYARDIPLKYFKARGRFSEFVNL